MRKAKVMFIKMYENNPKKLLNVIIENSEKKLFFC
jgi:hypothetical protein